ncbi:hypothetical protein PPACK8108_LOCUS16179 [Phakopsora pachyrhizi]|uniref:Uncharacterized protein n=1 Tax=Phakopsora pachyrhizi TaxID=170000 RepID=A0AAV0B770_PHAPC|nr:hypothetical protein PPACK8108_LOCUS16179 [Phakopsora pachyrhizi]
MILDFTWDLTNPPPLCTPVPNLGVAAPSSLPPHGSGSQRNPSQGVVDSDGDVKSEEGDSDDDNDLYHGQGYQTINLERGRSRGWRSQGKDDHMLARILWLLTQQISGVATTSSGVSPAFKTPSMKAPDSFDGPNPSNTRKKNQVLASIEDCVLNYPHTWGATLRKRLTITSRSTDASATKSAPTANATAPAPATSAELSMVTPPVAAPAGAKKQNSVGQAVNSSLKQTVTLVQRVTGKLCSNANQTIDSFGNSISQRKQQAFKRFSRQSVPAGEDATVTATPHSKTTKYNLHQN